MDERQSLSRRKALALLGVGAIAAPILLMASNAEAGGSYGSDHKKKKKKKHDKDGKKKHPNNGYGNGGGDGVPGRSSHQDDTR